MTSRATLFTLATAAAFAFASMPAGVAMPVDDLAKSGVPELVQVQAKKKKKSTRQQEIDQSVESGSVPKRYKSSVPKQYHHLIPFAK